MLSPKPTLPRRISDTAVLALLFLLGMILFAAGSLWLGRDVSWDVRNYHYYNGYAALTGRLGFDLGPAQLNTFLNPVLDILAYLCTSSMNARWAGALIGMVHGLNFGVAVGLAKACFDLVEFGKNRSSRWGWSIFAAALGCAGPSSLREIGALYHDNAVSILVVGALWCSVLALAAPVKTRREIVWLGISGLLFGLASGLKMTTATLAFAATLGWCGIWFKRRTLFGQPLLVWAGTGLAGFLAIDGYHMVKLWRMFGSPMFPYFNYLFRSPWVPPVFIGDEVYPAHTWKALLMRPIQLAIRPSTIASEQPFRYAGYLILCVAVLAIAAFALARAFGKKKSEGGTERDRNVAALVWFLTCFCFVGSAAWAKMFGYSRYMVSMEMVIPLFLIVAAVARPAFRPVLLPITLLCVLANAVLVDGYREPRMVWSARYIEPRVPTFPAPEKTMVVMIGGDPTAYVIPSFDPRVRFVRPEGSLFFQSPNKRNVYGDYVWKTIAEHDGDLYVLVIEGKECRARAAAAMPAWTGWTLDPAYEFRIEPAYGRCPHLFRMQRTLAAAH